MLTLKEPSWLDENLSTSKEFRDQLANVEDIEQASFDRRRYYNLADMVGAPCAYHKGQHYCTYTEHEVLRGETYPGTIVDRYWKYPEVHGHDRPYTNAVIGATESYLADHPEIQEFLDKHDDDQTLWAHCRLGDMGLMDQTSLTSLIRACKAKDFKRVVLCTGTLANWENLARQHSEQGWSHPGTPDEMFERTHMALHILVQQMKDVAQIPVQFSFGHCDEHFCMMYKVKHLWVHRGAFSALLAFIGQGSIYRSPSCASLCNTAGDYPRKDLSERPNYIHGW
jgi:hypothetical protein